MSRPAEPPPRAQEPAPEDRLQSTYAPPKALLEERAPTARHDGRGPSDLVSFLVPGLLTLVFAGGTLRYVIEAVSSRALSQGLSGGFLLSFLTFALGVRTWRAWRE